jgi:hypothetical protein
MLAEHFETDLLTKECLQELRNTVQDNKKAGYTILNILRNASDGFTFGSDTHESLNLLTAIVEGLMED